MDMNNAPNQQPNVPPPAANNIIRQIFSYLARFVSDIIIRGLFQRK
jgi:hypothetical protein